MTPRAKKLYNLLQRHASKGWLIVRVDDLRATLGMGRKYPRYSDFRRKVLQPSLKELERAGVWLRSTLLSH